MTSPYSVTQIEHTVEHVGRQRADSKRRIRWVFFVTPADNTSTSSQAHPTQHELVFTWSVSSGKQEITFDGNNVSFGRQKGRSVFNEAVDRMGEKPDLRIVCTTTIPNGSPPDFTLYELLIDDVPYRCYPVAANGQGRQEVYLGGAVGGLRPPSSILDITDPGKYDGCGSPDYVPPEAADDGGAGAEGGAAPMDATSEEDHHVGFRTEAEGDDLAQHEYEKHRHDYPKTHFPAPPAAEAAESMDLLSFDAPAPAPVPPASAPAPAAPTCEGMLTGPPAAVAPTALTQTQQPPSSYANDLLSFGTAPAPAPAAAQDAVEAADAAMANADGHVSFSSLTPGDDLTSHEYDQHRHDYPKTHFPGTEGAPPAKTIDPHVGFQTVTSDDSLTRHEYEKHRHDYPKTHWVADGAAAAAPQAEAAADGAANTSAPPAAGVNPFDAFAAAPPPQQQGQQQQPPPPAGGGGANDLLSFP